MAKILLTGGSDLIGTTLRLHLLQSGYSSLNLSRRRSESPDQISWPKSGYIDAGHLQEVQGIIHLAGAGEAEKRWTPGRKKEIIDSRTELALLLLHSFKAAGVKPTFFISASGTGYYDSASDKLLGEEDRSGNDFLAEVCRKWETSAMAFSEITERIIILRTGLVLAAQGGVLRKLLAPAKYGIGTNFGSGEQYWPWIHLEDMCGIYMHAIRQKEVNGIYNAVAGSVCQKDFASCL